MKSGKPVLWSKLRNVNGRLKELNSYCTLYEENLKNKVDSEYIDELIILSRQFFLDLKKYEDLFLKLGI